MLSDDVGGVVIPNQFAVVLSPEKPRPRRPNENVKAGVVFLDHLVDVGPDLC